MFFEENGKEKVDKTQKEMDLNTILAYYDWFSQNLEKQKIALL